MRRPAALPDLPRDVWLLEAAGFLDALGNGLVMPFLVLFLHDVVGAGYAVAGAIVATIGGVGLLAGPFAGIAVDRLGARRVVIAAIATSSAGYALLATARSPAAAAATAAVLGVAQASFWPAHGALVQRLAGEERAHAAFSMSSVARNAGLGAGAAIAGLAVGLVGHDAFRVLIGADAAFTLVAAVVVARVRPLPPLPVDPGGEASGGYLVLLRDRALLGAAAVNAALIASLAACFDFLAPYLVVAAGLGPGAAGLLWAADTVAIVALQLPIGRRVAGRRRMTAIAAAACTWAVGLLVIGGAGRLAGGAAIAVALAGTVAMAVGECVQTPLIASLIGLLPPPGLEGRYQAAVSMSWDVGGIGGPALAGLVFAISPGALWPCLAAVALAAAGASLAVERTLPEGARRTARWHAAERG